MGGIRQKKNKLKWTNFTSCDSLECPKFSPAFFLWRFRLELQSTFCATVPQSKPYLENSQILQRIFKDFSIYKQMYVIVYEQLTLRTRNPVSCSISSGCHSSALTICSTALPCHAEMVWSSKGFSKEKIPSASYHSVKTRLKIHFH